MLYIIGARWSWLSMLFLSKRSRALSTEKLSGLLSLIRHTRWSRLSSQHYFCPVCKKRRNWDIEIFFFSIFFSIFVFLFFFHNLPLKSTIEFEYSPTDFDNLLADRPAPSGGGMGPKGAQPLWPLLKYFKKGNYRGSPTYGVFTTLDPTMWWLLKYPRK